MSTKDTAALQTAANDADRTDPLEELEFPQETGKRGVYEEFEFHPRGGTVGVVNASHGDDAAEEHTYTVDVDAGVPTGCSCPAKEYHCAPGEACKHMVAVALAKPVCEVATDGGIIVADDDGEVLEDDEADQDGDDEVCPNGHAFCPVENDAARDEALICFDCFTEKRAEENVVDLSEVHGDAPTESEEEGQ